MSRQADRVLAVYKARDGWRWHTRYGNKVVAESGEAYNRKESATRAAKRYGVGVGFPLVFKQWNDRIGIWTEERLR